jgi:hypothetical protein
MTWPIGELSDYYSTTEQNGPTDGGEAISGQGDTRCR